MIEIKNICPECKSNKINHENGEIYCNSCGLVIEEPIDEDDTSYKDGKKNSRIGEPVKWTNPFCHSTRF